MVAVIVIAILLGLLGAVLLVEGVWLPLRSRRGGTGG